jgi:hypothetical protein
MNGKLICCILVIFAAAKQTRQLIAASFVSQKSHELEMNILTHYPFYLF